MLFCHFACFKTIVSYLKRTDYIHNWQQKLIPKTTRNKAPNKISNEALLEDVEQHSDDYMYERAQRLGCSNLGIASALKHFGICQKKTLEDLKACIVKGAAYQNKLNNFTHQGYPIVFMDESGFECETIRPYVYAPINQPCIDSYN